MSDLQTSAPGVWDSRADIFTKRKPGTPTPPPAASFILLESGSFVLLESGGKIQLE